jgi:hypothetical protein
MLLSDKFVSLEINLSCDLARTANLFFHSISLLFYRGVIHIDYLLFNIANCDWLKPLASSKVVTNGCNNSLLSPFTAHSLITAPSSLFPRCSRCSPSFQHCVVNLQYRSIHVETSPFQGLKGIEIQKFSGISGAGKFRQSSKLNRRVP